MKPCRRLASRALVLAVPVFACLQATPAQAVITVTGEVAPSYDGSSPWDIPFTSYSSPPFEIGTNSVGSVDIGLSSRVYSGGGTLGVNPGSEGTMTVNWTWHATTSLSTTDPSSDFRPVIIGQGGDGTLLINSGILYSYGSTIGQLAGSTGTVTVTGAGALWRLNPVAWTSHYISIGGAGTGTLNIENGGRVNFLSNVLGGTSTSIGTSGTLNVQGQDSSFYAQGGSFDHFTRISGAVNVWNGGAAYFHSESSDSDVDISGAVSVWDAGEVEFRGSVNVSGSIWISGTDSVWNSQEIHLIDNGTMDVDNNGRAFTIGSSTLNGTLNVQSGGRLVNSGDILVGSVGGMTIGTTSSSVGVLTVSDPGSEATFAGDLTVGEAGNATLNIVNGGRVNATSLSIGVAPGSSGTISVTGPGTVYEIKNNDLGQAGNGTLNVENGAEVLIENLQLGRDTGSTGTINLNGGTLLMSGNIGQGNGSAAFNYTGGMLKSTATINLGTPLVQQGGTFAPGESIGQTTITGDYDLIGGTMQIELGGAGNPIDLVDVTGDVDIATLGTTLDLNVLDAMAAGTYTFLQTTGGTITGEFENVLGLLTGASVQYSSTSVSLTLLNNISIADIDLDGFVGINDLNVILGNWNQSVPLGDRSQGDIAGIGDGFVGIDDLSILLANWNQGTPPGEVVPEPGSVALLLAGLLGFTRSRSRGAA